MNRLWLREYESILIAGRKDRPPKVITCKIDMGTTPQRKTKRKASAKSDTNKGDKMRNEEKADLSENVVAQRLLALTLREDYDRTAPQQGAKLAAKTKELSKCKKEPLFGRIQTLSEFEAEEKRREEFFELGGNTSYFDTIYPDMQRTLPPNIYQSPTKTHNQKSNFGETATTSYKRNTMTGRPKSSPTMRSPQAFANTRTTMTLANDDIELSTNSISHVPSVFVKETVAEEAEGVWSVLLDDLWDAGHCIEYSDVTYLEHTWEKGECTKRIVQYIAALLGLRSSLAELPTVAERSIFREILSLLKFFREVVLFILSKACVLMHTAVEPSYGSCKTTT